MEPNVIEFVSCDCGEAHSQESMGKCYAYLCVCGNGASQDGFFPINHLGKFVEPTHFEWTTNEYGCACCGRRINGETGAIVGTFDLETAQAIA